jgi:hypothetical protein
MKRRRSSSSSLHLTRDSEQRRAAERWRALSAALRRSPPLSADALRRSPPLSAALRSSYTVNSEVSGFCAGIESVQRLLHHPAISRGAAHESAEVDHRGEQDYQPSPQARSSYIPTCVRVHFDELVPTIAQRRSSDVNEKNVTRGKPRHKPAMR